MRRIAATSIRFDFPIDTGGANGANRLSSHDIATTASEPHAELKNAEGGAWSTGEVI
jgi:hypothetical protein